MAGFSSPAPACARHDPTLSVRRSRAVRGRVTTVAGAKYAFGMRSSNVSDAEVPPTPSLELRQLLYFLRVVECGSFTKAAADLRVAQPAISMGIRKLERSVGMRLLRREKNGIELTAEGEVLLAHARAILHSEQRARADLDAVRGLKNGSTKIGIPPQFFSPTLVMLIGEFLERYPGLSMNLVDAGAPMLKAMLADGRVDLAVLSENEIAPSLEAHVFLVDELGVVAVRGHEILEHETIDLAVLANFPMAIPSQVFWQRRVLERALSSRNVRPNIRLRCAHIEVLKAAIRHSRIVAPMVHGCISGDADLVWRRLTPPLEIKGYLCRRPDTVLSVANQALLNFLMSRSPLKTTLPHKQQ